MGSCLSKKTLLSNRNNNNNNNNSYTNTNTKEQLQESAELTVFIPLSLQLQIQEMLAIIKTTITQGVAFMNECFGQQHVLRDTMTFVENYFFTFTMMYIVFSFVFGFAIGWKSRPSITRFVSEFTYKRYRNRHNPIFLLPSQHVTPVWTGMLNKRILPHAYLSSLLWSTQLSLTKRLTHVIRANKNQSINCLRSEQLLSETSIAECEAIMEERGLQELRRSYSDMNVNWCQLQSRCCALRSTHTHHSVTENCMSCDNQLEETEQMETNIKRQKVMNDVIEGEVVMESELPVNLNNTAANNVITHTTTTSMWQKFFNYMRAITHTCLVKQSNNSCSDNEKNSEKVINVLSHELLLLQKRSFDIIYHTQCQTSVWCGYILTERSVAAAKRYKRCPRILPDYSIPNCFRRKVQALWHCDYDKSHLAPHASVSTSEQACIEAAQMSNIILQRREVNQGVWVLLENATRAYVREGMSLRNHMSDKNMESSSAAELALLMALYTPYSKQKSRAKHLLMENDQHTLSLWKRLHYLFRILRLHTWIRSNKSISMCSEECRQEPKRSNSISWWQSLQKNKKESWETTPNNTSKSCNTCTNKKVEKSMKSKKSKQKKTHFTCRGNNKELPTSETTLAICTGPLYYQAESSEVSNSIRIRRSSESVRKKLKRLYQMERCKEQRKLSRRISLERHSESEVSDAESTETEREWMMKEKRERLDQENRNGRTLHNYNFQSASAELSSKVYHNNKNVQTEYQEQQEQSLQQQQQQQRQQQKIRRAQSMPLRKLFSSWLLKKEHANAQSTSPLNRKRSECNKPKVVNNTWQYSFFRQGASKNIRELTESKKSYNSINNDSNNKPEINEEVDRESNYSSDNKYVSRECECQKLKTTESTSKQVKRRNKTSLPDATFMAIWDMHTHDHIAFIVPNKLPKQSKRASIRLNNIQTETWLNTANWSQKEREKNDTPEHTNQSICETNNNNNNNSKEVNNDKIDATASKDKCEFKLLTSLLPFIVEWDELEQKFTSSLCELERRKYVNASKLNNILMKSDNATNSVNVLNNNSVVGVDCDFTVHIPLMHIFPTQQAEWRLRTAWPRLCERVHKTINAFKR